MLSKSQLKKAIKNREQQERSWNEYRSGIRARFLKYISENDSAILYMSKELNISEKMLLKFKNTIKGARSDHMQKIDKYLCDKNY